MSKVPFTDEQIEFLKENPYTFRVTPGTLYLTKEFKALFYEEYQNGSSQRYPRGARLSGAHSRWAACMGYNHNNQKAGQPS